MIAQRKEQALRPSEVLKSRRAAIRAAVERYNVRNPRVFGSVLTGADTEGSDLDLLVDAPPGTTLFDLGGLESELEQLLGVKVEVLTPQDLPPRIRLAVLSEAQLL